jgi:protein-disulfide isomerase
MSNVSQKQAFGLGIVSGVLVLCTLGFFVLLGVVLNSDDGKTAVAPTPSQPSGVVDPGAGEPTDISINKVDGKDHIRGNEKAKVTIVEYSDMDCPFCSRFHETMNEVVQKYGDDVRWVYRHFPLDSLHPNARNKAIASECAGDQGKFWEFMDDNFQGGSANVTDIAKNAGVKDISKFEKCVSDKKFAKDVQEDEQDAQAAGGRGTPYSILLGPNGETIPISGAQPFASVEAALQQFL